MMDRCAPGYTATLKSHHWRVDFGGKRYRSFPKGPGRHQVFKVWTGHVEKLVDVLGVDRDCASKVIRQLSGGKHGEPRG